MENIIIKLGGNILEAKEYMIAHQCNCISTSGKGLAKLIFEKYPEADIYVNRIKIDKPGTNKIIETKGKKIINMFGQYNPGKGYGKENKTIRLMWFKSCLDLLEIKKGESIAMPYLIGCGLAGGNWKKYSELLLRWAKEKEVKIVFYDINNESLNQEV